MRFVVLVFLLVQITLGFEVAEFRIYQKELLDSTPYLISEKYDGVRGVWDSQKLKTKRGNVINAPQCFLDQLPPFALDGELWLGYGRFEEIQSLVNTKDSTCAQWRDVQYLIFDSPSCGLKDTQCLLSERLAEVERYIKEHKPTNVHLIAQHRIESHQEIHTHAQVLLQEVLMRGGEGVILRPDELGYKSGRAKNAFKLKAYTDSECKVIGYTQGSGRLQGKVGALICEQILKSQGDNPLPERLHNKRITFKIGSGLSDSLRDNPPKIGTIITYQYSGLSKNGIPKHTRFLRVSSL